MTSRIERFLKPKGTKPTPKTEDDTSDNPPYSLHEIFQKGGKQSWLTQNHPLLLANFNLINKTLHPERPLAKGVATISLKGTTFPDKRELAIELAERIQTLKSLGEILLEPEPENPYDANALAAIDAETKQRVGYIPKAKELNKAYIEAIEKNQFCGAYIVTTKINTFQGNPSAILTVATGWR
jgi:hypothetical protein